MVSNTKKDILFESEDGYREEAFTRGIDIEMTTHLDVLWQVITGALKTQYGEVKTEKHATYGSYIHKLIGKKNTGNLDKDLNFYIDQVLKNYKELDSWNSEIIEIDRTSISFYLEVYVGDEYKKGVVTVGTN